MSVMPLVPGKTVMYKQEAFDAAGGASGDAILITNCDESQFSAYEIKASYDLRVGCRYRDHRRVKGSQLPAGQDVELLPGMAVIVQTEEEVHFPRAAFGVIMPKVSLLQVGLTNTTSKIDPGYHGPLLITAFNLGKRIVRLQRGQPFCALYVLKVGDGATLYGKSAKTIEDLEARRRWDRWRYLLEANLGLLTAMLTIATLALIALNIVLLALRHG